MKKIGILSMQRVLNYGSFLQAYSLKQMLEELGGEVQFVDYRVKGVRYCGQSRMQILFSRIKALKIELKKSLLISPAGKFIRENLFRRSPYKLNALEEKFFPKQKIMGISQKRVYCPKLDLLVIGSDEVFNCLQETYNVGFSPELFGAHNRAKDLISYAASFGNTTAERLENCGVSKKVGRYLKRFDAISVRDNNSGKVVKKLTGREAEYHLDPVLVGKFDEIIEDNVEIKDYIIVYGYPNRFTEEEGRAIREFAQKRGKKLIAMCGKQKICDEYIVCSPTEILSYFSHADAIITDTFHGSIFSIINHKPFASFIRSSEGGSYGNQEKLIDMLGRLGLEDRIVKSLDDPTEIIERDIDYSEVDNIRNTEREKSLAYLKKFIKD